ncbi:T9SS type A sorting domain-containing protein [Ferruginibacter sp. SUN106]|uniref:T9SS type A sorting domain-containing protein n=1 Tax=Ferruginibacter sp. SUN106 TaxID=2978348 RepID=UPI003D363167
MKIHLPQLLFIGTLLLLSLISNQHLYAQVQTGKSYINVSKNITGGTFEPGDTLEIRAAIAVGNFAAFSITQVRYNDTINANFTYLPGTLKIITNEGLTFRSYTDAASDDAAMFNGINQTLRINMGKTAGVAANTGNAVTGGGTIAYNDKPSFYGGVCIMVASFRVKIKNAVTYNSLITMPGGAFRYTQSAAAVTAGFAANNIMVFQNIGVCPNYVGGNAVIENNGTFGSGNTRNRSASAIVPGYSFVNFSANQPNDGSYGIANNTSAAGATNNGVPYPDNSRVFSVWDIIGDHTGAVSATAGNPATTVGSTGGYMAIVNASYATNPAIQQTITNLCPSTYYDFSAWFRNICSKCSCDSNGRGALNALFNGPYPPGVKPNLTFQLNGIDYYTTGDISYNAQWVKKGFTYLTGGAQTSFTLSIRNNSPGGGGNDWAVDDVNLSTCVPDLILKYNPEIKVCKDAQIDLSATIRCFFPNYVYYKWQKSTNGGSTWFDTGISGVGSPALVSGQWEYTANYPLFLATMADSGHRYRAVVATTPSNLTNVNCAYSNNASTMLNIINCGVILNVNLRSFTGQEVQSNADLNWSLTPGSNVTNFEIEKSIDGINFSIAGTVKAGNTAITTNYSFNDPDKLAGLTYYRLKLNDHEGLHSYSPIIILNNKSIDFAVKGVTNPVTDYILLDITVPRQNKINIQLSDMFGHMIFQQWVDGKKGWNKVRLDIVKDLPQGMYMLSVASNNQVINKRIIKMK